MSLTDAEKNRLKKVGLTGLNKPKRTPNHPTKKGVVAVRDGKKMKIIRFEIKRWVTITVTKLARVSKLAMRRTSRREKHQQLSGRTNFLEQGWQQEVTTEITETKVRQVII